MDLHISLAAEELFSIGPVSVTNSMFTMFLVMGLILLAFRFLTRKRDDIPGRGQGFIEVIVEFLLGLVEGTGGRHLGRRIFPLVSGIFIFILFANFSGLLPGVGTIGVYKEEAHDEEEVEGDLDEATPESQAASNAVSGGDDESGLLASVGGGGSDSAGPTAAEEGHDKVLVPIFRPPTADLNMTLALSLLTFTVVQVAGISAHGVVGRIKHMADPPFLFPIELISEFSRILSLSARLFGNVFAGEVLLGVMYAMSAAIKVALLPAVFPVVFIGLEVLFGTIQALVFALLTLIYITLAAAGHDDHGDEHAHEHAVQPDEAPRGAAPAPAGD